MSASSPTSASSYATLDGGDKKADEVKANGAATNGSNVTNGNGHDGTADTSADKAPAEAPVDQVAAHARRPSVGSNKWTWDIALVFNLGDSKKMVDGNSGEVPQTQAFGDLIHESVKQLVEAGLHTTTYLGQHRDTVICLVGATEERLRIQAAQSETDCELDGERVIEAGRNLQPKADPLIEAFLKEMADRKEGKKKANPDFDEEMFHWIYAPYNDDYEKTKRKIGLFRTFDDEGDMRRGTLFRWHDRVKLTWEIITGEKAEGGACFAASKYAGSSDHPLRAAFPLHSKAKLEHLKERWMTSKNFVSQPLDEVRSYFGEQVAMYFAFMEVYARWLVVPAIIGAGIYIRNLVKGTATNIITTPFYGLTICLWATLFLEFWRRKESSWSRRWGQHNFLATEASRPDYHGDWVLSPVDGRYQERFAWWKKLCRQFFTHGGVLLMITVVIMSVVGIFLFKKIALTWSATYGGYLSAIINSIQIQILNFAYSHLAVIMTTWENHRTESEYSNALIFKTFLFKFVNSYNSLIYIAFIKKYEEGCTDDDCIPELAKQLGTLFVTSSAITHVLEYIKPYWTRRQLKKRDAKLPTDAVLSQAEIEERLQPYSSTFDDFSEVVIVYGYATLFVVAFPLAPFLCLVSVLIEIKLDSIRLTRYARRPLPTGAQNIGEWYSILNLMGLAAVITNCALVIFVAPSSEYISTSTSTKWLVFVFAEHIIFLLKAALYYFVPDVPERVRLHLLRQEYVARVHLEDRPMPDEYPGYPSDEVIAASVSATFLQSLPKSLNPNDPHLHELPPNAVPATNIVTVTTDTSAASTADSGPLLAR